MNDGILLVDKPKGMTSHDVVACLRRTLKRKDIGHAGTLDPEASGLLVLLLGDATKLSDVILNGDKSYHLDVRFGTKTDSGDLAGAVTESSLVRPTIESIDRAVEKLVGHFEWEVPMYSAVKVDGKKLYQYARAQEEVVRPQKTMIFSSVKVIQASEDEVRVELTCSKGSFMRVWAEKLGEKLGTVAVASGIRRTQSSPYSLAQAVALNSINAENAYAGAHWVPINNTLQDWPFIRIEGTDEKLISNGQIPYKMARYLEIEFSGRPGVRALSRRTGRLVALLTQKTSGYSIQRVFPSS